MSYPFIQARWFGPTRSGPVEVVVMHTVEGPERPTTAEGVAHYFQNPTRDGQPVKVSAHYCVDADSIVQCVRETAVAWAAPGANHNGVQVELAGYAAQSGREWADDYSTRMLTEQAVPLVREVCQRYDLPVRFVDATGLRAGMRGVTTHAEVSKAFRRSTHTDPGLNFPMGKFLALVSRSSPPQEGDLTVADAQDILEQLAQLRTDLTVRGTTGLEQTVEAGAQRERDTLAQLAAVKADVAELRQLVERALLLLGGETVVEGTYSMVGTVELKQGDST